MRIDVDRVEVEHDRVHDRMHALVGSTGQVEARLELERCPQVAAKTVMDDVVDGIVNVQLFSCASERFFV